MLNEWNIFELLRGNKIPSIEEIPELINNTDDRELKEGVIEFLLAKKRSCKQKMKDDLQI